MRTMIGCVLALIAGCAPEPPLDCTSDVEGEWTFEFYYATEDGFDLDLEMSVYAEASNPKEALFTGALEGSRMQDQLWYWTSTGQSDWCLFSARSTINDMKVYGESGWDMSFMGEFIGGWGSGTWWLHKVSESYKGGWMATLD